MDRNRRTILIIISVVLALGCCCVLLIVAAVATFVTTGSTITQTGFSQVEERTEQVFVVEDAPTLEVDNIAGPVTIRRGQAGEIRVVVTKRAGSDSRLNDIRVELSQLGNTLEVRTSRRGNVLGNMSVELEISVPADAIVDASTNAGDVKVSGVEGEITARTNAGNVEVRGATASVELGTELGNVSYEGEPRGRCTFSTSAGDITLRLPADANVRVQLNTSLGNIDLGGFDVQGDTSGTDVDGVIGTGEEGTIIAETALGNVELER